MSITNLAHIKKFFGGTDNPEEKRELYKEMLLMTLSRATRADLVTNESEVETVQGILLKLLGEEVSSADIRVAAASELFETAPISKYLERVGPQLDSKQNRSIVSALIEVFGADGQISALEVDFFNMVVEALNLTPAETAGLVKS